MSTEAETSLTIALSLLRISDLRALFCCNDSRVGCDFGNQIESGTQESRKVTIKDPKFDSPSSFLILTFPAPPVSFISPACTLLTL